MIELALIIILAVIFWLIIKTCQWGYRKLNSIPWDGLLEPKQAQDNSFLMSRTGEEDACFPEEECNHHEHS